MYQYIKVGNLKKLNVYVKYRMETNDVTSTHIALCTPTLKGPVINSKGELEGYRFLSTKPQGI